ncbi:DMT family transporter [Elioraea rosea]|uniref:DMT family transporter n=1 Tax=Elioraea rosea TaxID=2492390 RepID=UPI001315ACA8|nr:DMT family transporter [Elioraea rosea]
MSHPSDAAAPRRADALAFVLLGVLGALWGLTPVIGKSAFQLGATPLGYVFRSALTASLLLLAIGVARRRVMPLDAKGIWFHLGSGLIGFAAPNLIGFLALRHVPAGLFAMVIPAAPLLTFVLAALTGQERPTWRRFAGVAIALAGTLLALSPGAALPVGGDRFWAFACLAVPASYALSNIFTVRFRPGGADPLALACGTASGAAFWLASASLLPGEPWGALSLLRPPEIHDAFAVAQGTLTAVAYAIYFRLLTRHGGIFASQVGYVLVVTGLGWGAAVFGEIPGLLVIPATVLIFAGLALVTSPAREDQSGQKNSRSGIATTTTTISSGKPSGQ